MDITRGTHVTNGQRDYVCTHDVTNQYGRILSFIQIRRNADGVWYEFGPCARRLRAETITVIRTGLMPVFDRVTRKNMWTIAL